MASDTQLNIASTQRIVNDHIFGQVQLLDPKNPKQGITHTKFEAQNVGNIPGVVGHWNQDLDRRKQRIKKLSKKPLKIQIFSLQD